jgi:hypothetical protein
LSDARHRVGVVPSHVWNARVNEFNSSKPSKNATSPASRSPTASKHTTPHIRRDQAHRVEQRCSDSALRAESEYRHGELALGARPITTLL